MTRFILSIFIFLFSFNFLYAGESLETLVSKYKNKYSNNDIAVDEQTFVINSQEYTTVALSAYIQEESDYTDYTNTTVYICKSKGSEYYDCKSIDLYLLRDEENISFAAARKFITFEIGNYYLTLKEKDDEFYLHKFSTVLMGEQDKEYTEVLSSEEYAKSFKIKMQDITPFDLIASSSNLKDYTVKHPELKNFIYNIIMENKENTLNNDVTPAKINGKDFSIFTFVSNADNLLSTTDSWCYSNFGKTVICEGSTKLKNCKSAYINITSSCGTPSVNVENDLVTFSLSGQDRHGIESYSYTIFKYINNDFYLHREYTVRQDVHGEEPDEVEEFYSVRDGQYTDRMEKQ